MKTINEKLIKELLPKRVDLYYIDYRDSLDNHLDELQESIQSKSYEHVDSVIEDWSTFETEMEYISDLKKDLEAKGFSKKCVDLYVDKHKDDIRNYLWDIDDSNPITGLLRNTSSQACFYDLKTHIDDSNGFTKEDLRTVKKALKIKVKDTTYDKILIELLDNASYGGNLVIYFLLDDYDNFITGQFNQIEFSGKVHIGLIHNGNGSGFDTSLPITLKINYNPENFFIDKCTKYSYVHEVCGMTNDFCKSTKFKLIQNNRIKIKKEEESPLQATQRRNKEYQKTFDAGGCTFGDINFTRHRDVFYRNDYPAGNTCPHCKQFWID